MNVSDYAQLPYFRLCLLPFPNFCPCPSFLLLCFAPFLRGEVFISWLPPAHSSVLPSTMVTCWGPLLTRPASAGVTAIGTSLFCC